MSLRNRKRAGVALIIAVAVLGAALLLPASQGIAEPPSAAQFDSEGQLRRPEGYREWVFVGTPVTPNDMNNGMAPFPEFHAVYIDPGSWAHYRETGEFREGTILVKELISVGSKQATSGAGYFMGEYLGLEAAVKSKGRFENEPGGWAYFSFTTPDSPMSGPENRAAMRPGAQLKDVGKAFPTGVCASCHQASAAEDMVFTQFYPVLRAAKAESR